MTIITKPNGRELPYDEPRLLAFIQSATARYPHLDTTEFVDKTIRTIIGKETYKAEQITNLLMMNALELIGVDEGQNPKWTHVAAYIHLRTLYKEAAKNRCYSSVDKYDNFYGLIKTLTDKGIYSSAILEKYTKKEIEELGNIINVENDNLFTYIGLKTLSERYLAADYDGSVYELPQERYLVVAMTLMQNEPKDVRMHLVKEAYWAESNQYMTVATPTLSNAGKSFGQLSSCFIDTVDDSLEGIYNSNTDVARLSRDGGGIGVYMGNVRAEGSDIRGFKGASSGVVPWIRQLNGTAVSVDQLG